MSTIKKIGKFIASRALYLALGVFLAVGATFVYAAWDTKIIPNSSTPLTSALWNGIVDKLEELDERGFGDWTSKSENTVYQASTDGMVVCESSASNTFAGYTDGSNPPTTIRTRNAHGFTGSGITMPVKKGDYWKVTASSGTHNIFWISFGN